MGRLRKDRVFGQRSAGEGFRVPKRVFVLSTEGNTEAQYFEGLKNNLEDLASENNAILVLYKNDTKSAPKHIVDLMDEYALEVADSGIDNNEFWVIFDRDKQNNKAAKLLEIITQCEGKGYNIGITNPTFELFLLMHIADIGKYKKRQLLENPYVTAKRRFLDKELSVKMKGYNKTKIIFEKFRPNIPHALKQAKKYEKDPRQLVRELGTTIHKLINEILNP